MILLKETAGDTLAGSIDGVNFAYTCSFDFNVDTVNVYVNGRLKIRDWDDGFVVVPPRTVHMKEPLLTGDSLEIEYKSDVKTGGGALGGCPDAPIVASLEPEVDADQLVPGAATDNLEPTSFSGENKPVALSDELKPVIINPRRC